MKIRATFYLLFVVEDWRALYREDESFFVVDLYNVFKSFILLWQLCYWRDFN